MHRATPVVLILFICAQLTIAIAAAPRPDRVAQARQSADDDARAPARGWELQLAEFSFDPAQGLPELPGGWERSRPSQPDLHLVQLDGATRTAWLDAIEARGFEVVQYVHPHTYIVWGSAEDVPGLHDVEAVRATAEFAPAFRVLPQWRELAGAAEEMRLLLYRGADTDAVVRAVQALGGVLQQRRVLNTKFELAGFELPGQQVRTVANIPGVYSIQRKPTDGGLRTEMGGQVCANNVDVSNLAFPGYPAWLGSVGVDGSGVIIANVDGGIQDSHPDLAARMLPCTGTTCGTGQSSHGTHTAGIMAGDGTSGTLDGFGFLRGLGVAPGANLIEQNYSPFFQQPGGMLLLMEDSQGNGASLSGNSWGPSGSPLGYDNDTLQVDIGVRDADPDTPGNQPLSFVLSFMNGNGGTSTQGTPDEAKNIFTIGSTKLQTSGGSQLTDIDDLSSNSAHGPALDGRTIPHMVAPGCQVDSTDTTNSYSLKCGTSMASPHVSGAVALFIEYYRGLIDYVEDPSPAMVKAAFLGVARNLAGNQDADGVTLGNPFDNKQGWGRMDVEAVVDPPDNSVRYFDNPVVFDETGEEWVSNVSPLDPGQPVRIMLVWTDAPGHGLGGSTPAWNNDLDLVVETGAGTFLGNNFGANGFSTPGGTADAINNTEGVFLSSVLGGGVTIRVVAADINSDAIPGAGDATDQDFALACYNCAVEPAFTLGVDPASQQVCAPDSAIYTLNVGEILGFSDPVSLSVSGVPAGATASIATNPVTPPDTTTLEITDTGAAAAGEYELLIEGVSGELQRSALADLRIDTAVPAQATSSSPADGAIDVPVTPTLSWGAVPQAFAYDVEVSLDPGFGSIVYSATESGTSHTVELPLETVTTYYWRIRAHNGCGEAPWSAAFSFTTLDFPPLLLVDDDDNNPDVQAMYTAVLDAMGVQYDVWDTGNSDNEPDAATLAPYEAVIWFTGDEFGGSAGPGSAGEAALGGWLDFGGCLVMASQDYHYDRGLTPFMQSYLGVGFVNDDEGQSSVTGQGTVFAGMGPYSLVFPFTNYSDIVAPDAVSELAFEGNVGNAGVLKASGTYLTTFWGFGLETIATVGERQEVLNAFFEACADMPQPDTDGDGAANSEDCLPADPTHWAAPEPAQDLTVSKAGLANLDWSPPDVPGSDSVTYDVLRSDLAADLSGTTCIVSGISGTLTTDMTNPTPESVYHYLIRVLNDCGGNLGYDSAGVPRTAPTCP